MLSGCILVGMHEFQVLLKKSLKEMLAVVAIGAVHSNPAENIHPLTAFVVLDLELGISTGGAFGFDVSVRLRPR